MNGNPLRYIDPTGEVAFAIPLIPIGKFLVDVATVTLGLTIVLSESSDDEINSQVSPQASSDICVEDDKPECDEQYYNVDIPTCRGISRSRGKLAAARCYESAAERYAACLAGLPMPPLDTWNN